MELGVIHELSLIKIIPIKYHHDTLYEESRINTHMNQVEREERIMRTNQTGRENEIKTNAV